MKCPYCGSEKDSVVDSRKGEGGKTVRRRRRCENCGKRYNTIERVEFGPIYVVKKNGARVEFDRDKIEQGILRACNKRNIPRERITELADEIDEEICCSGYAEISTDYIGDLILQKLLDFDKVAYIRFASVYKNFGDASEFMRELDRIKRKEK